MAEAEKIKLLELDINTDAVVKDIQNLKEEVTQLSLAQQKAKLQYGELSKEYIDSTAQLKNAQQELSSTEKLYQKLTDAQKDNAGTLQKLEAENAKLRKEQKTLNLETEEGIKRNKEINDTLNKNNATISGYSDKLKQNKMAIGGYADAMEQVGVGAVGAAKGILSTVKAALAFVATPLGAVLTLIAGVVGAVVKAFARSEAAMNKLRVVTGALSGVFNGLINLFKPAAEFIAKTMVKAFETLGNVAEKTINVISKGLKILGFESAAKSLDSFTQKIKESAKAGSELADMENRLIKAQRESEKIQLDYQKRAEKLRQIRDDESNSIEKRIKANNQLGEVLKEQLNEELKIANLAFQLADKRVKLEGETKENLDARAEALTKISDIQERITGQESEQLANLNSLRKEAADKQKQLSDEERDRKEKELEEARKLAEEKIRLFELEVEKFKLLNRSKIDNNKKLTIEQVQDEENRLKSIYDKEVEALDLQAKLFPERQEEINNERIAKEIEYNESVSAIREEYRISEFERLEINYQNEQAALENSLYVQFEAEKKALERSRLLEIEAAKKTGADVELINKKYAKAEIDLEKAKQQARLALVSNFAQNVANLFGESTKIGKIAASTQTTVNTIQGALAAYSAAQVIPPPAGPIIGGVNAALVVGAGVKAVRDIWAVKSGLPGDGGGGGGNIPEVGGAGGGASQSAIQAVTGSVNPEIGQGIISRTQTNTTEQIAQGVEQGMSNVQMQPVLAVDDVTSKQLQKSNAVNTQTL